MNLKERRLTFSMKSRHLFFLCLFMFLTVSSSLFAYSSKYFSVSDKGWNVQKKSDTVITFLLKDYTPDPEDQTGITPFININIKSEDKTYYVSKFDQKELDKIKSELENKGYKEMLDASKKESMDMLNQQFKQLSKRQKDEVMEKVYGDSGIKSANISKVGKSKAFRLDYKIAQVLFRRFIVVSLFRYTIIEFAYPETFDLDSSKEYKDFMASFKNFDKEPTTFNGFVFGKYSGYLLQFVIAVVIGVVGILFKKFKGY